MYVKRYSSQLFLFKISFLMNKLNFILHVKFRADSIWLHHWVLSFFLIKESCTDCTGPVTTYCLEWKNRLGFIIKNDGLEVWTWRLRMRKINLKASLVLPVAVWTLLYMLKLAEQKSALSHSNSSCKAKYRPIPVYHTSEFQSTAVLS